MKKLIVSICTAFCLMAAPLSAIEWGGLLFNDSGVSTPDFSAITIKQSDGVSFWVKTPLGEDSGLYFSSEALYKFNIDIPLKGDTTFTQIVDVPLLKVSGDLNLGSGVLSLNAGRFYYVDASSAVIAQVVDGVSVSYGLPLVKVGGFVGYTGLLNALNTPMAVAPEKDNKFYNMAYPYLPVGVTFELPSLLGNQSLEFDGYYLLDLGSAKDKNNLFYASAILSGPITNSIYYNLDTTVGLLNFKDAMNYSSLSLLVFPSEAVSFTAGATFGSADQGPFVNYASIATSSILAAGRITPKVGLSYTTGSMYAGVNGDFMLAYADSKYSPSNTDWNIEFIYNIFTDLQVGLTVNTTFDLTEAKANNYVAKLNISLAF